MKKGGAIINPAVAPDGVAVLPAGRVVSWSFEIDQPLDSTYLSTQPLRLPVYSWMHAPANFGTYTHLPTLLEPRLMYVISPGLLESPFLTKISSSLS